MPSDQLAQNVLIRELEAPRDSFVHGLLIKGEKELLVLIVEAWHYLHSTGTVFYVITVRMHSVA